MAQKIEVEFELKYKEAVKNLDEFQKEYSKLEKEVVSANKKTAESLEKVEKGAKDGAKGIKKVGISIGNLAKASGIIFLLQKAFEFVSSAIQENQAVMDSLNVVFDTAQAVFNQVVNVFVDIYKNVSSATENFDALGKVMSSLITLVINPFKAQFFALKLAFEAVQLAYEKMFGDEESIKRVSDEIDKTKEKLSDIVKSQIEAGKTLVNNFVEAATEIGDIGTKVVDGLKTVSVSAALETAKTNQELKKSAEIAAAQSRILLEQFDRQAELQRQIRDDETKSIAERQAANNELNTILEKQETEMTKNAQLVKAAAQAQFDLTGKTEDYVRVLEAEADIQGVAAQVTGFKSEQQTNANALTKEATELKNAELESESLLSIEKKRFNAELIEDELLRLSKLAEIDILEAEQETTRLQAIVDNAAAGTQAKIDAQITLDDFTEQSRQTNLTRQKEIAVASAEISETEADAKIAALDAYAAMATNVSNLLGKETAAGKALSVAAATISTYTSATKAYESQLAIATPDAPIRAALAAGVAVATGLANVKKILSVQVPGGGGAPTGGLPSATSAPTPPAFNVVGASGETQLADAIGGQTQRPTRAFVVSNDVTTAQELDRNIIEGASI